MTFETSGIPASFGGISGTKPATFGSISHNPLFGPNPGIPAAQ
jgi:hypothetical protein